MNKKIKNATPNTYNGLKFRSKLEVYTYKMLMAYDIYAEYESNKYELVPAFVFAGVKVRPMTYTPDFVGNGWIIECKGFGNDLWPVKEKLFKWFLSKTAPEMKFYVVKNQKEVDELLKTFGSNTWSDPEAKAERKVKWTIDD